MGIVPAIANGISAASDPVRASRNQRVSQGGGSIGSKAALQGFWVARRVALRWLEEALSCLLAIDVRAQGQLIAGWLAWFSCCRSN